MGVRSEIAGLAALMLVVACGPSTDPKFGGQLGDSTDMETDNASVDATGVSEGDDDDDDQFDTSGGQESSSGDPIDCAENPDDAACDCEATDENGTPVIGACDARCVSTTTRLSLWNTNYNVDGTLGYGEHQGLGLIGYRYVYDTRFEPPVGVQVPWDSSWTVGDATTDEEQFANRTMFPGGETYVEAVELPEDDAGLYPGETVPLVPMLGDHPLLAFALCEAPEAVADERFFNHGRTLAERVPNHEWDNFFGRRNLIPLELLEAFETTTHPGGSVEGPGTEAQVLSCLDVMEDAFCESRCGNCSYILPAPVTGTPFPSDTPGNQIAGVPTGSTGPFQRNGLDQVVNARQNFEANEAGRTVYYVGGSSWGSPDEVSSYGPSEWPDPDGVPAEPEDSWMSFAGDDTDNDGVADWWTDPFTHCLDPSDSDGSQIPVSLPRFISGRYGHNSNTDAEALFLQFQACAVDAAASAATDAWNTDVCHVCGVPSEANGAPAQMPCVEKTSTANAYWERSPGTHDVSDFDLGKYSASDSSRTIVEKWSELPDAVCSWSGEPVFGM